MSTLSREEIRLLDLIERDYLLTRTIPSQEVCFENYRIPRADYTRALKKPEFREALAERGVEIKEAVPVGTPGLTPKQLAVINVMLDTLDNRSEKKKLADFKVSTQQWQAWLRDPAVQHYLRERTEGALDDNQFNAHLALIDRVREGDLGSIKYFNELTGRYISGGDKAIDAQFIVTRVLEIVIKYVDDPVKLEAMSEELMALGRATSTARQLTAVGL